MLDNIGVGWKFLCGFLPVPLLYICVEHLFGVVGVAGMWGREGGREGGQRSEVSTDWP